MAEQSKFTTQITRAVAVCNSAMYAGLIIVQSPGVGPAGTVALVLLPPIGAAGTLLALWVIRAQAASLLLGSVASMAGGLATAWSQTPATFYAFGLCFGALPGALWWHAIGWPRERPAPSESTLRFPSTPAAWARLTIAGLTVLAPVAVAVFVTIGSGLEWGILLAPPLMATIALAVLVRRAHAGWRMPPVVLPACAIVIALTGVVLGIELVRELSPARQVAAFVLGGAAAGLFATWRVHKAIQGRIRKEADEE